MIKWIMLIISSILFVYYWYSILRAENDEEVLDRAMSAFLALMCIVLLFMMLL